MSDYFNIDRWKSIQIRTSWYKIIQQMGVGGTSTTHLAMCTEPPERKGTLVAIKFFRKFTQPDRMDKFLSEFDFLRQCDHPSLMRVFDVWHYYERPIMVVEYLPKTLKDIMKSGNASIVSKVSYAMQLLSALVYLDGRNVVHRDIKPENIFIRGDVCVLGDFGLMKRLRPRARLIEDQEILKESVGPGMPFYYRTPDLVSYLKDETPLTTSSDVYQLGLVLAELFSGWNPLKPPARNSDGNFDFTSPIERESIKWISGQFGGQISALIEMMLNADPDERPTSHEMLDKWDYIMKDCVDAAFDLEGRAF